MTRSPFGGVAHAPHVGAGDVLARQSRISDRAHRVSGDFRKSEPRTNPNLSNTRPRETPNSRVRDLVDLVLILDHEAPSTERVSAAVDATFRRRGTHSATAVVPPPRQVGQGRLQLSRPNVDWSLR